jgi:hypothetical protein
MIEIDESGLVEAAIRSVHVAARNKTRFAHGDVLHAESCFQPALIPPDGTRLAANPKDKSPASAG